MYTISDVMISNAIVEWGHSVSNLSFRSNLTMSDFHETWYICSFQSNFTQNGRGCLSLNPRNSVSTRSNYIKLFTRNVIGQGIQICH